MRRWALIATMLAAGCATMLAAGCAAEERVVSPDFEFDGTCVSCHAGLSAGQVHPTYKLRCVDCHGGDDQAVVPDDAAQDAGVYRDPELIAAAHVAPKPGLARFFWANGIDDDGDGLVDEGPTFDDDVNPTQVLDFGEIAEPGLHGEGVGNFVDTEYNRDMNYTRWVNPGDLRVATMSCGGGSRVAQEDSNVGACHQQVVEIMRRSIMVNQAAVINGAYYGNESWRPAFQDAQPGGDPRAGAFGFVLDFASIDDCIDLTAVGEPGGRGQPVFDSECLERAAQANDPNAAAGAPGNAGLPAFEATQGEIGPTPGVQPGATIVHEGVVNPRFQWGGNPLKDPEAALPKLAAVPDEDLLGVPGVPDPVDNVLRGFRAYYPLNYPGSGGNFPFTFGTSILPEIDEFVTNNPFGRGHSSGCTACHMSYNNDGSRNPQRVVTEQAGGLLEQDVVDPTTKHREFDPQTQDVDLVQGVQRLVGMAVTKFERERLDTPREQQRFYSAQHEMTTAITTQQCGLCHTFVTRIDMALQGMAEPEQRDALARRKPIRFATPAGTQVNILSSFVREQAGVVVIPEGVAIIELARERDRQLDAAGFIRGGGGCAPTVYTEDCNNDGELGAVTVQRFDRSGNVIEELVLDEDLNGNGALDLIDLQPREDSADGRQRRYIYGGANGSTRLMDVHFEAGMHCIDCHFLQDSHGDGNLYHTNWEQIEIECEDCHGTLNQRTTLITSGANGLNDLRNAFDHDGVPYFVERGSAVVQRSRVTPGLEWEVSQVPDTIDESHPDFEPRAVASHSNPPHMADFAADGHSAGSTLSADGALQNAELECYSCHMSWVLNCMGCHYNMNLGDDVKRLVNADGSIDRVAGENEVWFNNHNQPATTNFQLLGLMRSPFVLGVNAKADGGRLSPFRSSMIVHLSVSDADGHTLFDNMTFSTLQEVDGNSGRRNVVTSGSAMNQTMPHTVRRAQTRDCDSCHALVDASGRVLNDHVLAVTYGVGGGRYPYVGDWVLAVGDGGLELFEHKQEGELKGTTPGASSRFPGLIVNPNDRVTAAVEPLFDGSNGVNGAHDGTGIVLIRNFAPLSTLAPTLRDLAIITTSNGSAGKLIVADITARGHPASVRPSVGAPDAVFVVDLPDVALGVTAISPDVSDPFVYVANGTAGITAVQIDAAPATGITAARVRNSLAVGGGASVTAIKLVGDVAYAGTDTGELFVIDLAEPHLPVLVTSIGAIDAGGAVRAIDAGAFMLYVATDAGLSIFDISDPKAPRQPTGLGAAPQVTGFSGRGLYHSNGHVYVAAGAGGVRDIDVTVNPPMDRGDIVAALTGESVNANDVILSALPMQNWLLIAEASGDLIGVKLDNSQSTRERCLPGGGCGLDLDWRDPTIMGRDPSLDPDTGAPDGADPSGPAFFRQTGNILGSAVRLARPALWEQLGTQTGRRVRDSFMPGSGALSLPVMQRMYEVRVCEVPGSPDVNGNGLGELGDGLAASCTAFAQTAAPHSPLNWKTRILKAAGMGDRLPWINILKSLSNFGQLLNSLIRISEF